MNVVFYDHVNFIAQIIQELSSTFCLQHITMKRKRRFLEIMLVRRHKKVDNGRILILSRSFFYSFDECYVFLLNVNKNKHQDQDMIIEAS